MPWVGLGLGCMFTASRGAAAQLEMDAAAARPSLGEALTKFALDACARPAPASVATHQKETSSLIGLLRASRLLLGRGRESQAGDRVRKTATAAPCLMEPRFRRQPTKLRCDCAGMPARFRLGTPSVSQMHLSLAGRSTVVQSAGGLDGRHCLVDRAASVLSLSHPDRQLESSEPLVGKAGPGKCALPNCISWMLLSQLVCREMLDPTDLALVLECATRLCG